MKVLGIDASLTGTGLCLLDLEKLNNRQPITITLDANVKLIEKKLREKNIIKENDTNDQIERKIQCERWLYIEKGVEKYAKDVELVVIENYAFDAKYRRESLAELQGIIKRKLYLMNIPFLPIDTKKEKKVLTGFSSNPTSLPVKQWVLEYTKQRYNIDFKNEDNECDAFGLAIIALALVTPNFMKNFSLNDDILININEVINAIHEPKKIKKNLNYYFNIPYYIECEYINNEYIVSIPDFEIKEKNISLKKALVNIEKQKRNIIREMRKTKKRISYSKKNLNKVSFKIKKN